MKQPSMFHRASLRHELDYVHEPSTDVVCVLVHGTFAPETAWTQEGSLIRRVIDHSLSGQSLRFCKFIWRGKAHNSFNNTHADRLIAGQVLSRFLESLTNNYPSVKIILVGHSHGGNVILYALRELSDRSRVRGVVTIATPFLIWEASDDFITALIGLPTLAVCVLGPGIAYGYLGLFDHVTNPALLFAIHFVSFLVALGLLHVLAKLTGLSDWFRGLLSRMKHRCEKCGVPCIDDVPRFSAYVGSQGFRLDEALTWVAFGDWVSRLPRTIPVWLSLGSPSLLILSLFVVPTFFDMSPLTFSCLLICGVILMPSLVRTSSLFFGGEPILMNVIGKIELSAVPPSIKRHPSNVERGYRGQTWFAHGLYNSTEVVQDVAEWVASRCCSDGATPETKVPNVTPS